MEIRVLGDVTLYGPDGPVTIQRVGERIVLAVLAINAGEDIEATTLLRLLGEGGVDQITPRTLKDYVAAVRTALQQAGGSRAMLPDARRRRGAYRLDIDPDLVDYQRFARHARAARDHADAGDDRAAADSLRQATGEWHGQPLAGIDRAPLDGLRHELTERYRAVARDLLTLQIHLGQYTDATRAARRMIDTYPSDDIVVLALHALARDGRRVEIPDFRDFATGRLRALLDDDHADFDASVRDVADTLLKQPRESYRLLPRSTPASAGAETDRDTSRFDLPPAATASTSPTEEQPARPSYQVPRQLPAAPQVFTGRAVELADLDKIHDASTVVITAIDGMAGVGKTALAVHAAHQMVDRYPDGQLFIDLHGYTDGVAPIEPGEALNWMLRSLGVAGERIPTNLDQRAGLYRSRLADQRMLIVLDNAATESQVTPLLPGAPGCVVLVTSRRRLAGFDHTHTLSLDTLPLSDAITLLRQTAGESRLVDQPPNRAAELVELCGRLPLAIRIAAARLRSHPTWDLEHLVQLLRDQRHRLVELEAGRRSVTAALDLSYQDLSADLRRAYRLVGLHTGPDIDAYAAAALLDGTLREAARALEQLLEAHLLQEPVPGRYRFHDLTRAHAARVATRDETEHGGRLALDRLLDYYQHTAAVAMDTAYPHERQHRPRVPPSRTPNPTPPNPAAALGWLDTELPNLMAAAKCVSEHGGSAHPLRLSTILHRHLHTRGRFHDAEILHQQALTTARATGDQTAELNALTGLGHTHRLQGRHEQATDHYRQALRLAPTIDNQAAELDALAGLGQIHYLQARYDQAKDLLERALRLADTTVHHPGELVALTSLGVVHRAQGRHEQATVHLLQALHLARATGYLTGEQNALAGLGMVYSEQGRYEQATDYYRQSLRLARASGHASGELQALIGLADLHLTHGRHQQATDDYERVLDLARQIGHLNWQFEAWQGLGRLRYLTSDPEASLAHHHQALVLATDLGQPGDQARAHDGLANAHLALRQPGQARTHWRSALDLLTRLGVDHVEETTAAAIRHHLATLDKDE